MKIQRKVKRRTARGPRRYIVRPHDTIDALNRVMKRCLQARRSDVFQNVKGMSSIVSKQINLLEIAWCGGYDDSPSDHDV